LTPRVDISTNRSRSFEAKGAPPFRAKKKGRFPGPVCKVVLRLKLKRKCYFLRNEAKVTKAPADPPRTVVSQSQTLSRPE
jgi:hypothetical protein